MFARMKIKDCFRDVSFRVFSRLVLKLHVERNIAKSDCYRFSRRARFYIFILLLLTDQVSLATGLVVAAHRIEVTLPAIGGALLGWAGFYLSTKLIHGRRVQTSRDLIEVARIEIGICVAVLTVSAMATPALFSAGASETIRLSLSAGCVILVLGRLAIIMASAHGRMRWVQHVLLIGTEAAVAQQLRRPLAGGAYVGYAGVILIGKGSVPLPVLGRIGAPAGETTSMESGVLDSGAWDGGRQARRLLGRVDRIVLLEYGLERDEKLAALEWLERFSHEVRVLQPEPPHGISAGIEYEYGVLAKPASMRPFALCLKRTLDILLSLAALIVMLPALLIVAALVRIESEGPALFRQPRLGCDNLPFTVFKFRTMRQNDAADGSVQAVRGDARITRLGAILRKTSMDELPQLLNVLNGSMSLVGPRPHPVALNCRFEPFIARYAARHSVLPGITGWAQINGARGETPTVEAMQRRVELDLEYVRRQSILLDLWILFRTVGSVLMVRNVY